MRVENEVHMQLEGQEGFPAAIQTLDLLNTELCLPHEPRILHMPMYSKVWNSRKCTFTNF